jgi:ketosteroid isomerase-like protein
MGFIRKVKLENVKRRIFILLLLFFTSVNFFCNPATKNRKDMKTGKNDEAAIRELENRFAVAVSAGDVDGIMKNYIQDKSLVVFDVVPRKEYLGADAYRKDWIDFFTHYKGLPKLSITDLGIVVEGNLAFSYSFMHVLGTDIQDHPVNLTVRVTAGYRKFDGNWLKVLEHISVPVDLRTGKADINSKPE